MPHLTFCHLCRELRPEACLSLYKKTEIDDLGCTWEQNIRYCNDKEECKEGAKTFSMWDED